MLQSAVHVPNQSISPWLVLHIPPVQEQTDLTGDEMVGGTHPECNVGGGTWDPSAPERYRNANIG